VRWRGAQYGRKSTIYGGTVTLQAFADAGFEGPVQDDSWDVLFTHREQVTALASRPLPERAGRLALHCNYFRAAGQKCRFARHLARVVAARKEGEGGEWPRHLRTYMLMDKAQHGEWRRRLAEDPHSYWVVKPCAAGNSSGLRLVSGNDGADGPVEDWSVAQEYVLHPFLGFGGRKFHLRMYVFVTRWDPVGAFLFDDGLIFRSRHRYSGYQRPSVDRDLFSSIRSDVEPLTLAPLWSALGEAQASAVRARIISGLAEILGVALEESFGTPNSSRGFSCFDLFGIDVMLDEHLTPFVLEFNIGPNLWVDSEGSEHVELLASVKRPLVEQMVSWAALRARQRPRGRAEAEGLEARALPGFTRIL